MELTSTACITRQFHNQLLSLNLNPLINQRNFSYPFQFFAPYTTTTTTTTTTTSIKSRHIDAIRKSTCCLASNDSNLATKVAVPDDLSLAIKKKAGDVTPELKGTSIFLVGMNNSIKSSLGKLLASTLRYYYFDSDSLVEDAVGGASAAKSFRESDEKSFLESETEVLKQLSSMGRMVVCAGDGAVQSSTNLALLRHGISIWIDIPTDMVARDAVVDEPSLSESEMLAELAGRYEEMRGGYATADTTISLQRVASQLGYDYNDLDKVTTEDLTMEVLNELEKLMRVKKMLEEAARPF